MRSKIIAGNWKMNKTAAETARLIGEIRSALEGVSGVERVVCPPYTSLAAAAEALKGSSIVLGAQNVHWEATGAFTGEISVDMLREAGVRFVLVGHSERRRYFGETDETVNRRVRAALTGKLHAIVCVGETLKEREADTTRDVIERQVRAAVDGLAAPDWERMVLAYEPVWAIGTGRTATAAQAQDVHAFIRSLLKDVAGVEIAERVRIQYGGSMKPENAAELLAQPDIDGGLIGGAALQADSFAAIAKAGL